QLRKNPSTTRVDTRAHLARRHRRLGVDVGYGSSLFRAAARSLRRVSAEGAHSEPLCHPLWLASPSTSSVGPGRRRLAISVAVAVRRGVTPAAAAASFADHVMTSSASPWRAASTIFAAALSPSMV